METSLAVKSAVGIAEKFNLSDAFAGLASLSVGTDLPEIFVTLKASFLHLNRTESSGIITGNAIGSSICQMSTILGIAGLLLNISITRKELIRDGLALFLSLLLLGYKNNLGCKKNERLCCFDYGCYMCRHWR